MARLEHAASFAALRIKNPGGLKLKLPLLTLQASLLVLTLPARGAAPADHPLTVDEIFSDQGLVSRGPENMKWSLDGKTLAFIQRNEKGESGDLLALDGATGQRRVLVPKDQLDFLAPPVDKSARSEREKERRNRYHVSAYDWSPDSKSILFVGQGNLFLFDLRTHRASQLTKGDEGVDDPKFSPDGRNISFLKGSDLWVVPSAGGEARRLTKGGTETLLNGALDWVYPEELDVRSGYFWSPDSKNIAFLQLDESPVPVYPIADYLKIPPVISFQRYPKAGMANPKARVGIISAAGGEPRWIETPAEFEYVPRIEWADEENLSIQYLNRHQNRLDLVLHNIRTGTRSIVVSEIDPHWVNVSDDVQFLPKGEILWSSERSGQRHLYVFDRAGRLTRQLTKGSWSVSSVTGVDSKAGWIYYLSTEKSPIELHFYRVPIGGGTPERLTSGESSHNVKMDHSARSAYDISSSLTRPPSYHLLSSLAPGWKDVTFAETKLAAGIAVPKIEPLELKMPDGALGRGQFIYPKNFDPSRKYPVLMYVYGGPSAPVIHNAWGGTRELWHWLMAEHGFLVFYFDDRTSSIPGHEHEIALHKKFGFVELADHREAVKHLRSLPFVDGDAIGIWGWSGGGYTTAFDMFQAPELFKAGVAVAGLYAFEDYDTLWTERYMGLPSEEPAAYKASSDLTHAAGLKGKLLLCHGDSDDNVHFQNAVQLAQALISAGKDFDFMIYPNKTHGIAGEAARKHLFHKITAYFETHLH